MHASDLGPWRTNVLAVPVIVCAAGISGGWQFWLAALLPYITESPHTL